MTEEGLYVVRLWDGSDGLWVNVTEPVSKDEADRVWNEHTNNGTEKTTYADMDYYRVFPADTIMMFSYESGQSQRD